jgi:two-component system, cell cycle sensor histidine kinase and response regulator CckA
VATILVADDNATNRLLLSTILEAREHVVLEAGSGDQAWAIAKERQPDLTVVDLHMPGLHGVELIKRLRSHALTASIKVVIYSATTTDVGLRQFMKDVAVDAVLPKPSEPNEVIRIIEEALATPKGPV